MFGISRAGKEALGQVVENFFDRIALQFIGNIPKLKDKKNLIISSERNFGLPHLFIQALGNRTPNSIEQSFLGGLLDSAHGYIESLKNKTVSNVTERIDGMAREASLRNEKLDAEAVKSALNEELEKSKSHMMAIVESEGTKVRNLGHMTDITRRAADLGDDDPTVFFIVLKDNLTCKECARLHLNSDGTPKLWKFKDLKQGYHKRGEDNPSAFGLHPFCRCVLAYMTPGFHFNKEGKFTYHSQGYDAYSRQKR